jgi:anti-sigma regulatory factor (Ser/Thr protein kinase)
MLTDPQYLNPRWEQCLSASLRTPGMVRGVVDWVLRGWGLDGDAVQGAQVIMSELVTNALVHARVREVWYRIEREGLRVRLAVWDESAADPVKAAGKSDEETGRGLELVEALSAKWGVDRQACPPRGKWVWALVECESAACGPGDGR